MHYRTRTQAAYWMALRSFGAATPGNGKDIEHLHGYVCSGHPLAAAGLATMDMYCGLPEKGHELAGFGESLAGIE